jgi:hypothetical protein
MDVKLVVERGGRRRELVVRSREAVLGRGRGNAIRIPSPEVSRQHCRLHVTDGYLEAEDLDSVNGTFVNGFKISGRHPVRPGDRLEVGPVLFRVEYEMTVEALAKLKKKGGAAPPAALGRSLLQGLADGSIVDGEAFDDLEIIEDDVPVPGSGLPMLEVASEKDEEKDELEMIRPEFDFDSAPQLPNGTAFRDILSQMEDLEDSPPPPPPPKKKPKKK